MISPRVAELDHGRALGVEQVAHQALVGLRAGLVVDPVAVDPAVELAAARPRGEAALAVEEGAADPLDRVVERPLLAGELVEAVERRLRGAQPRLDLLVLERLVVLDPEPLDQRPAG